MQEAIIILLLLAVAAVIAYFCFRTPAPTGKWMGTDVFVQKAGLDSLGALIKANSMTLFVAAHGLNPTDRAATTLFVQDYKCVWSASTVTVTFTGSSSALGPDAEAGALLDDGTYSWEVIEAPGTNPQLVIFDDETIYLHFSHD